MNLYDLSGWDIIVAEDCIESEAYAAEELSYFIEKTCKLKLSIVTSNCIDRGSTRHLFIGMSRALAESNVPCAIDDCEEEDFRIVIRESGIAVAGGRPRGTLYGVYTFLEDYFGVRFLTGDHTHTPAATKKQLVGPVDRYYHPQFAFRWPYYYETNNDVVMATRQRTNTIQTTLEDIYRPFMRMPPICQDGRPFDHANPKYGGVTGIQLVGHSLYQFLPAAKYGKSHPEYFSLYKGKRIVTEKQNKAPQLDTEPCLTHPDVIRIVTQGVRKRLEENRELKFVFVSQNDVPERCECPTCRAADEREGSAMGSLLTCINAIADDIAVDFPDVLIGTLAYHHTQKPPKHIRPRKNVYIQLCSIECCRFHALNDPHCKYNLPFKRDLDAWSRICENIGVWTYETNFQNYMHPFPNLRVIEKNIKYLASKGIRAAFMQAVYDTPCGEFSDLRNYLLSSLMWNPDRSGKKLINEFIELYYGRAAVPIREYIDLIHDCAESTRRSFCSDSASTRFDEEMHKIVLHEEILDRCMNLFARAIELADSRIIYKRVEIASMSVYRAAIEPCFRKLESDEPFTDDDIKRFTPLIQEFFRMCTEYGALKLREPSVPDWRPIATDIKQIEAYVRRIEQKTGITVY